MTVRACAVGIEWSAELPASCREGVAETAKRWADEIDRVALARIYAVVQDAGR